MYNLSTGDLWGTLIVALLLGFLAFVNIRKMRTSKADFTALRKRCVLWTEIAFMLFMFQLIFNRQDLRFLIFLGLLTMFTGSQWYAARYFERRQDH